MYHQKSCIFYQTSLLCYESSLNIRVYPQPYYKSNPKNECLSEPQPAALLVYECANYYSNVPLIKSKSLLQTAGFQTSSEPAAEDAAAAAKYATAAAAQHTADTPAATAPMVPL